jgi:hypothetical protein
MFKGLINSSQIIDVDYLQFKNDSIYFYCYETKLISLNTTLKHFLFYKINFLIFNLNLNDSN